MSRVKELDISLLLDLYGTLLTDKQQNILSLYYNDDYSLSEIAENEGISRQAVMDLLRRSEAKLLEWDTKLKLLKRFRLTESALTRIEKASAELSEAIRTEITAAANDIRTVWED